MLQCVVEPRGFEPRSQDFQSCAYTKSAKVPKAAAKIGGCYAVFLRNGENSRKTKIFQMYGDDGEMYKANGEMYRGKGEMCRGVLILNYSRER